MIVLPLKLSVTKSPVNHSVETFTVFTKKEAIIRHN